MAMVSPKRTRRPPPGRATSSTSGPLEYASRPSGTSRVTEKTALRSGSSKQGKARRASVASNWVVAMTWATPASSVNSER